jgi:predicted GNAT family N-acyltransferase
VNQESDTIEIKQITAEQTWDLRHRIMYPNEPFESIKLPDDFEGIHFGLFKNGRLVTVVSLFNRNNEVQFRKLATEISEQQNGYASKILDFIFDYATNIQATKIWCNAREKKAYFYEKLGLQKTERTYFQTGIKFVIMEKIL